MLERWVGERSDLTVVLDLLLEFLRTSGFEHNLAEPSGPEVLLARPSGPAESARRHALVYLERDGALCAEAMSSRQFERGCPSVMPKAPRRRREAALTGAAAEGEDFLSAVAEWLRHE